MPSILGVDAGGTFTDFQLWENSLPASGRGRISVYKRPSKTSRTDLECISGQSL